MIRFSQVNLKFYVISRGEIGPGVAAARFFPPQRGTRHQPSDGHERRNRVVPAFEGSAGAVIVVCCEHDRLRLVRGESAP